MKIEALILAFASAASAQSFHVTAVRDWASTDPAPVSRAGHTYVIVGTMDGKTYTAEQIYLGWGSQRFDVGTDYAAELTKDGRALKVVMHDKKGREVKERLDVVGVQAQ